MAGFAALARGPWQVFIAIACYWQANAEAWPSQETIATFTGYSSRALRNHVDVLESASCAFVVSAARAVGSR